MRRSTFTRSPVCLSDCGSTCADSTRHSLEPYSKRHARLSKRLGELKTSAQSNGNTLSECQNELSVISDKLTEAKARVDERSGKLTNAKPLIEIKKAIKTITLEIRQMDVSVGVVRSELMRWRIDRRLEELLDDGDGDGDSDGAGAGDEEDGDQEDEDEDGEDSDDDDFYYKDDGDSGGGDNYDDGGDDYEWDKDRH